MQRTLLSAIVCILIGCIVYFFRIPRASPSWRGVSLTFVGCTNATALIGISNGASVPVVLRDHFELEFRGVAPPIPAVGVTNLVIRKATSTNLIIPSAGNAIFRLSMPDEGDRWIAHLEFAPARLRTKVGEYLIRRQDVWATSLPPMIRGVPIQIVSQEFSK